MSRPRTVACSKPSSMGALRGSFWPLLKVLRRSFAAYKAYRKRRQHMRHVARLDDHLLRDIGLEREDVVEAKPFVSGYEGLEIEKRRR